MSLVSPRRRIFFWTLVIFVGAALLLLAALTVQRRLVQGEMTRTLNNARQLQIAMQMMALDSASGENGKRGLLPADLGIKSKAEFLRRLVENNYLSASDAAKLGEGLSLVNVSSSDPPDTTWIVVRHSKDPGDSRFVAFTSGGSDGVYRRPTDATNPNVIKLPNRQPPILPEE